MFTSPFPFWSFILDVQGKSEGSKFFSLGRDNVIKQWNVDKKSAETASKKQKKEKVLKLDRQYEFQTRPFRMFVIRNRLYVAMGDFSIHLYDTKTGVSSHTQTYT